LKSIERGLSLGPELAESHVRAAQYYWALGDWGTSEEHCKVAIALNPSDALVLTVSALKEIAIGHRLEALSLQQRAVTVDPLSAEGHQYLGLYLAAVEKFDEAEKEMRDARELSPTLSEVEFDTARVLVMQRRFDEALAMFEQMPADALREQGFALAHYGKGDMKAADEALSRLTTLAALPGASAHVKIYLAEVHAFRGDTEQAFKSLEDAIGLASERHMTASMIGAVQLIHRSPFFIPLRTHARWHALLPNQENFGEPVAKR
jgi:tetratricopeptide (TPR) repeat protein